MGESTTINIGITRHTRIGLLSNFQFVHHLGESTSWDRTGHFIWGHARANSAQGAPGAHRDLVVFLSEWNDMALRFPDNRHVAKGIMRRIEFSYGSSTREERGHGAAVAEGLLADDCEARPKFPEAMKAKLREIVGPAERSGQ